MEKKYRSLRGADQALEKWWQGLADSRATRAQLSRPHSVEDLLLSEAFFRFLRQMPANWPAKEGAERQPADLYDAALVAAVLARVRTNEKAVKGDKAFSFAFQLGKPKEKGGRAPMSELRFRQLQKSRTPEEFFTRICRAVALLGNKADLLSLADSLLRWQREYRYGVDRLPQKRLAVSWAQDYYQALSA